MMRAAHYGLPLKKPSLLGRLAPAARTGTAPGNKATRRCGVQDMVAKIGSTVQSDR